MGVLLLDNGKLGGKACSTPILGVESRKYEESSTVEQESKRVYECFVRSFFFVQRRKNGQS